MGEPDTFRIQHRKLIAEVIAEVVRKRLNKAKAINYIHRCAEDKLRVGDRNRFIEITETQLMNLHEGSIARFRLKPAEFRVWLEEWK